MPEPLPQFDPAAVPTYPDLRGRVALVTGGASGIGEALCEVLAVNGVRVGIADLDGDGIERVRGAIEGRGGEALALPCDVTSAGDLARVRGQLEERWGPPTLLFPFAGGFGEYTPIQDLDLDRWHAIVDLNLTASFLAIKTFLPAMIDAGGGSIVLMSSNAARSLDVLATAPYAAAKAGVISLARHVALEVGQHGVRVNCVCPATTRSARADRIIPPERQRELAARSPLGRLGYPVDTAYAAAYLASENAAWVTGAALDVAGGRVMA